MKSENLEDIVHETISTVFKPDCVRKKSNWSTASAAFKFDSDKFDPKKMMEAIPTHSPKLHILLEKIDALDKEDREKHGKLFKHFIFSDVKAAPYGAKMLASALLASGKHLGYSAKRIGGVADPDDEESDESEASSDNSQDGGAKKKAYEKIGLLSDTELRKTKNNNFYLLSSTPVYDQPISVAMKKEILANFNARPDNIHGENARIIIMDGGYKEGIDLFDIKYVHIFEPQGTAADQKQVIGRGTRTCGQKGLEFHPSLGWPLHVFIYDLSISETLKKSFLGAESTFDLYLKSMNMDIRLFRFTEDLESATILGSVDYDLNKPVHDFSVGHHSGGGPKKKLVISKSPPVIINTLQFLNTVQVGPQERMDHQETKQYIKDYFSRFKWTDVKMENLCEDKTKTTGGSKKPTVMGFTPTQDFLRNYFTPDNPINGMLLWHSTGSGKTCSAIATATTQFEPAGYTILWVTRTTLKNDIWKNMFDQVCHDVIRQELAKNPDYVGSTKEKQMKLLSKSWSIRPMSYKQFSNLVAKKNQMYKSLVNKNGEFDPLRKTLLIIDEAHKLYGGGDLSSIERPDMSALKKALQHSYTVSGSDSVKLLLMTATPITQNPMELIQIMNLFKPATEQFPEDFGAFSQDYLDEEGRFTANGRKHYLDQIAGYVSYLNRERDARQFAQPVVKFIHSPLIKNSEGIEAFDKQYVRELLSEDVVKLKNTIVEEAKKLEGDLSDLDASKFAFLKDRCEEYEGKDAKNCLKVARANIREILAEAKSEAKKVREAIKTIRGEIKNKNLFRQTTMKEVADRMVSHPEEFAKFKATNYYQIRKKCARTVRTRQDLRAALSSHPMFISYEQELEGFDARIRELQDHMKSELLVYQSRISRLKELLKNKQFSHQEKMVLRMNLSDARKTARKVAVLKKKELGAMIKDIQRTKKVVEKNKTVYTKNFRKTAKATIKQQNKMVKDEKRVSKKLKKTLRKTGELREEIENEMLKDLVNKYEHKISEELGELNEDLARDAADKVAKKENAKTQKALEKAEKAEKKAAEKAQAKAQKEEAARLKKEHTKTQKALEKAEKEAKKADEKAKKAEAARLKKEHTKTKKLTH